MLSAAALLFASSVSALSTPYALHARQATNTSVSGLEVDLGYSVYRGWHNASANLNIFQGIRYAQDTQPRRWQAPREPEVNRSAVIQADAYGPQCPQAPNAGSTFTETDNSETSEDCLFLNVYAPADIPNGNGSSSLPVWVWIHGGGYGQGAGAYDLTALIQNNGNRFLGVEMNYRLDAFGFLSSDEVHAKGVANAGILDQQLALHWVQQYVHLFGGDPRRVTLFGESAGAGSVMLHDIAYGGTLGTTLFRNSITSSPYLAYQYDYNAWQPSQAYYALASAAGCDAKNAYLHNGSQPIFECLSTVDSDVLKNATAAVSQSGTWGTWAFLPVTDGIVIQDRPSKALADGKVNGLNHLAGHNALEGASWVEPGSIETIDDLVAYLRRIFPNFSNNDIAKVLMYYPIGNASTDFDAPLWATEGSYGVTNLNQSSAATGQQERAIAIYGETTFICPSYWLAEAYSDNKNGGQGWKYQFSIPSAYHGADGASYFGWPYTSQYYSPDYILAFMHVLGNFIVNDNPSISNEYANGISTNNTAESVASNWPPYSIYNPQLMDFNITCPETMTVSNLLYCGGKDARNQFRLADAYTWEGGRGRRCDFWKQMGALVPE